MDRDLGHVYICNPGRQPLGQLLVMEDVESLLELKKLVSVFSPQGGVEQLPVRHLTHSPALRAPAVGRTRQDVLL